MLEVVVGLMVIIVILLFALISSVNAVTERLSQIAANQIQRNVDLQLNNIYTSLSMIEDSVSRLEDRFIPYKSEREQE